MLAQEAKHRVQVPEVPAREEVLVDYGLIFVVDDGARDPPAFPTGLHRAIAEVDVFHVELVSRIPAVNLVEHRSAHEQEGAEHRVHL